MTDEEKNSMELDIEAKYVGRTEKEFLNTITYAECLYILDTKNKYCDDIKTLSLLKIVDIVNEQSKEIEELKNADLTTVYLNGFYDGEKKVKDKIKAKIEELKEDIKYSANPLSIDNSKFGIKVLQSLLEKVGENNGTTEQMH